MIQLRTYCAACGSIIPRGTPAYFWVAQDIGKGLKQTLVTCLTCTPTDKSYTAFTSEQGVFISEAPAFELPRWATEENIKKAQEEAAKP